MTFVKINKARSAAANHIVSVYLDESAVKNSDTGISPCSVWVQLTDGESYCEGRYQSLEIASQIKTSFEQTVQEALK